MANYYFSTSTSILSYTTSTGALGSTGSILTTAGSNGTYFSIGSNYSSSSASNAMQVNGSMKVDGPLTVQGKDIVKLMEKIENRLAILQEPDPEKLEKFTALKKAYDHYKLMEKLIGE